MTARRLLWELFKHVLHGRGDDEVYVYLDLEPVELEGPITGRALTFTWVGTDDAFCIIHAQEQT